MFILMRGKTWNAQLARVVALETEAKRERGEIMRAIAARQRLEMQLLAAHERERELVERLLECTKLVGKLRLRYGATEEELEDERKRREKDEDLGDVDPSRASTDLHDQDTLEQRRKDGMSDGFQEL